MDKVKILIIVIVMIAIAPIGSVFFWKSSLRKTGKFAKPAGSFNFSANSKVQSNINTFMESQVSQYSLGKDNYYCSNLLYGYDDRYAYAWVYCSGFISKNNNELEEGTAFSIPTRLEYRQPDFQISGYKQPGDGSLYDATLRQIFPERIYKLGHPSNAEVGRLKREVRDKANSQKK